MIGEPTGGTASNDADPTQIDGAQGHQPSRCYIPQTQREDGRVSIRADGWTSEQGLHACAHA